LGVIETKHSALTGRLTVDEEIDDVTWKTLPSFFSGWKLRSNWNHEKEVIRKKI